MDARGTIGSALAVFLLAITGVAAARERTRSRCGAGGDLEEAADGDVAEATGRLGASLKPDGALHRPALVQRRECVPRHAVYDIGLLFLVAVLTLVFIVVLAADRTSDYALLADHSGSLSDFVTLLKGSADDPKIAALMNAGLKDGSVDDDQYEIRKEFLSLDVLSPTQSQIDLDQSVGFYLNKPASETDMLDTIRKSMGAGAFDVAAPAITVAQLTNEKYVIIDGHHRWSQQMIFAGPRGRIACNVIRAKCGDDAIRVLKLVHLAIAAVDKGVPTKDVNAKNDVFQMDPVAILAYYNGLGPIAQANYALIQPVAGEDAPPFLARRTSPIRAKKPAFTLPRAVMPQLDSISDVETKFGPLRAGIVNARAPF